MEGSQVQGRKAVKGLRQEWLQRSEAAFERMFAAEHQDELITFAQREEMACAVSRELGAWLLESHAETDRSVRPVEAEPPRCPKCKQVAERVTKKKAALPERRLTSAVGEVRLRREQWRCRRCRIIFFSAGPAAGVGDGGLQSAAGREGRASGGAGLVPGGQ